MTCPDCQSNIPDDGVNSAEEGAGKSGQNDASSVSAGKAADKKPSSVRKILTALLLALCIALGAAVRKDKGEIESYKNEIEGYEEELNAADGELQKYTKTAKILNDMVDNSGDTFSDFNKSVSFCTNLYSRFSPEKNIGYSSEDFHADKGIVLLKNGGEPTAVKIKLTYKDTTLIAHRVYGAYHVSCEWAAEWDGEFIELTVAPESRGVSEIQISNEYTDEIFSIIAIVTD